MDQMEQKEQKTIIRVCKQCNEVKNIDMFPLNCNSKYVTHLHRCKDCHKMLRREQNKKFYADKKTRTKEPKTSDMSIISNV